LERRYKLPFNDSLCTAKKFLNFLSITDVVQNGFKDDEEEIDFFKRLKPQILSKLMYYNEVVSHGSGLSRKRRQAVRQIFFGQAPRVAIGVPRPYLQP
jgi:hypothetical protein